MKDKVKRINKFEESLVKEVIDMVLSKHKEISFELKGFFAFYQTINFYSVKGDKNLYLSNQSSYVKYFDSDEDLCLRNIFWYIRNSLERRERKLKNYLFTNPKASILRSFSVSYKRKHTLTDEAYFVTHAIPFLIEIEKENLIKHALEENIYVPIFSSVKISEANHNDYSKELFIKKSIFGLTFRVNEIF